MTRPPAPPVGGRPVLAAVLVGGALGGVLRWGATVLGPDGPGSSVTILVVNVVGSFALALLGGMAVVQRRPALRAGLGPGLLGGFTTLSTATEQTRELLASSPASALLQAGGTLAACLLAVAAARALVTRGRRP